VVVVNPTPVLSASTGRDWDALHGLGREVWQGIDAKDCVEQLRQDRE
jgi:hypothetical protein